MKKVICLLIAMTLCVSLACPALAAQGFVPSVADKDEPTIVPPEGAPEGAIGVIRDADGNIIGYFSEDCLWITPLSRAETCDTIPDEAAKLLLSVYAALCDGTMQLPYEQLGLDPEKLVIRDLLDISWLCSDHPEIVEPQGITLELIFDMGVSASEAIYVMTYKNDAWAPIASVTNNGDGTVTCVFEHLCPVAFCVYDPSSVTPPATGDTSDLMLWSAISLICVVGIVVILASQRKRAR